jgi:hypothetical protein
LLGKTVMHRTNTYLHNRLEQDHRDINRLKVIGNRNSVVIVVIVEIAGRVIVTGYPRWWLRMDHTETKRRLRGLLQLTKDMLSARDLADEHAFVLETIAGAVAGHKDVGPEIVRLVNELARAMELTEGVSDQLFWWSPPLPERV